MIERDYTEADKTASASDTHFKLKHKIDARFDEKIEDMAFVAAAHIQRLRIQSNIKL